MRLLCCLLLQEALFLIGDRLIAPVNLMLYFAIWTDENTEGHSSHGRRRKGNFQKEAQTIKIAEKY